MINTKKVLLVFFVILIPTIALVSSIYVRKKQQEEVMGVGVMERECTPYINNMIPNVSYVGEEYIYIPKLVGCSIQDVEMELDGAPWLTISGDGHVSGVPTASDVGIHRVVLTVRSVSSENKYVEYIIVE